MITKVIAGDNTSGVSMLTVQCTCGVPFRIEEEYYNERSRCPYCSSKTAEPISKVQVEELHGLFFQTIADYRNA